jgi:hypothetical protein
MIKMAPILIEFGDGDTGYKMGITDEYYGLVTLYNAEPGEKDPPENRTGAYIVFKNVKSLDCFIEDLVKMRDAMAAEGTDDAAQPTKRSQNCKTCRWGIANGCNKQHDCGDCPNYNGDGHCKCTTVSVGQPCPYYEKWEESSDE